MDAVLVEVVWARVEIATEFDADLARPYGVTLTSHEKFRQPSQRSAGLFSLTHRIAQTLLLPITGFSRTFSDTSTSKQGPEYKKVDIKLRCCFDSHGIHNLSTT